MDERRGGDVAMAFLATLEARNLIAAKALLASGAVMIFPGGARFETLEQLIEWAAPRYRWVKKTHDSVETLATDDGDVVYVRGTLFGEWPDGAPFQGIRYIDRFEIENGLITRQDVWNDMGETRG